MISKRNFLDIIMGVITTYFLLFLFLIVLDIGSVGYVLYLIVDMKVFLVLLVPVLSYFLLKLYFNEKYIEGLFSENNSLLFTAFIAIFGLLINAIGSADFFVNNILYIYIMFYSLVCIVFTFLTSNKLLKSIFGISSLILIISLILLFFITKYSTIIMSPEELMSMILTKTGFVQGLSLTDITKIFVAILGGICIFYWLSKK